jgi:hypothetical protein
MTRLPKLRNLLIVPTLIAILVSCGSGKNKESNDLKEHRRKIFTTDKLLSQKFTINSERDTIIKGKAGTILRIYKNTFVDSTGKLVKAGIEIELKEALTPGDIILSGLTTTTDGKYLQTGGMIQLNASAAGVRLEIAKDKFIGTIIPNSHVQSGMKLFKGELDSVTGINWKSPVDILNDRLLAENPSKGHFIASDSAISLLEERRRTDAFPARQPNFKPSGEDRFLNEIRQEKGTNQFIVDYHSAYIFLLKKLGWANIDQLCEDPRTRQIEFVTGIENQKEFNTVYITLIFSNKGMYLPGYQRMDETFSFTHNDEEPIALPVGETATILATAYKDGKPYFSIKTIKILEKQRIELKLEATTDDKLKDAIDKQL